MPVPGLGDTKSILALSTGIFTWSQSEIRCILLSSPKSLEVAGFRQDGERRLSLDSKEARELVNVLGIFLVTCQSLDSLIQTLQLVCKVAVGQQIFVENLPVYISKRYLSELLQMSLCPMIVPWKTAVMPEAERKDLLLDLF